LGSLATELLFAFALLLIVRGFGYYLGIAENSLHQYQVLAASRRDGRTRALSARDFLSTADLGYFALRRLERNNHI
jgi:hypothetical protein